MSQHSWVRVNGFGTAIVPIPPFDLSHESVGSLDSALAHRSVSEYQGEWKLETGPFSVVWPSLFQLKSSEAPEVPPGFDLVAPGGETVFFQGPVAIDRLEPSHLVGEEESVVDQAPGSVTVSYSHAGVTWMQTREVASLRAGVGLLVCLQSRGLPSGVAIEAFRAIVKSVHETRLRSAV